MLHNSMTKIVFFNSIDIKRRNNMITEKAPIAQWKRNYMQRMEYLAKECEQHLIKLVKVYLIYINICSIIVFVAGSE